MDSVRRSGAAERELPLACAACCLLDLGLVFATGSGAGSLGWGGFACCALYLLALDLVSDGAGVCHECLLSMLSVMLDVFETLAGD